jgi:cobalamin biosynthesis protein CobW
MLNLAKIPTTVVTGFLGSGKTTLLRHILDNANGLRIAVIVNEFGELGIDGDILRDCSIGCEETAGDGNVYELANGCLCCTVQEEFFPVMQQLVARREQIDHILIETSGLALPKPLVQAFNWPEIKSACTVDAVITVVDGPAVAAGQFAANPQAVDAQRLNDPNLDHTSALHELFEDQLSAADLVILNKSDLMTEEQRRQVIDLVRGEIPEQVKIVESAHGRLDLEIMLGLDSASEETIDQRQGHHQHGPDEDHDHEAFDSIVIDLPEVTDTALLEALQTLVSKYTIYRAKGFVAVPGKPMRLVVQGVGKRFDHYYDRRWQPDEPRQTRLVLIGKDLDQEALRTHLERGLAVAA